MSFSSDSLVAGMSANQHALSGRASNLTLSKAPGSTGTRMTFIPGSVATVGGSSVQLVTQQDISRIGEIISTGRTTDFAIDGAGMLPVMMNGALYYTKPGSFGITDNTQTLANAQGANLQGYALDGSGNTTKTGIAGLENVSFKNVTSTAQSTSKIDLGLNLSQGQAIMKGPGGTINFGLISAATETNPNQIIQPGQNALGGVWYGDLMKLTSSVPGATQNAAASTFQLGGFAMSSALSAQAQIFGASNEGAPFRVATAAVPISVDQTMLSLGQGIQISITGGSTFTFTATAQAGQAVNGQFSNLTDLAAAINTVSGGQLRANIGGDHRLYIAAADANQGLSFLDVGQQINLPFVKGLVSMLGLDNVSAADQGIQRFATMQEASNKINAVTTLAATLNPNNTMTFGAAAATSQLSVDGGSAKTRTFQTVTSGYAGATTDAQLRRTATIQSSNHNLQVGDYVRINGQVAINVDVVVGAILSPGTYRVDVVTADSFTVGTLVETKAYVNNGGVPVVPLVAGTLISTPLAANASPVASWRKIDGLFGAVQDGGALQASGRTLTAATAIAQAVNGVSAVTITIATNQLDNFAIGDTIYISGSNAVNPGYYLLNAVAGGPPHTALTFSAVVNTVAAVGAAAPVSGDLQALAIAHAAGGGAMADVEPATAFVTKVSGSAGVLEMYPLSIGKAGTPAASNVTINIPTGRNIYRVGDVIKFRNLVTPAVVWQGITINQDQAYTINSVQGNLVTFNVGADGGAATANGVIGYTFSQTAAAAPANVAGTILGATAYIDHVGNEFDGLGVTTPTDFFTKALSPTYNPTSLSQSFASGQVNPQYNPGTINVFDGFGAAHGFQFGFSKIDNFRWAVEIYQLKNAQGTYDASSGTTTVPGQIASGYLTFNGNGQLQAVDPGLSAPMNITWNNGSISTSVTMNWGAIGGALNPGVTQLAGPSLPRFIQPDGNAPGSIIGFTYGKDGIVSANFSNGLSRAIYQIPIAMFANFDGLIDEGSGLYTASPQASGTVLLQTACTAGAGSFISGALNASTIDASSEILDATTLANLQKMLYSIFSTEKAVSDYALQKL